MEIIPAIDLKDGRCVRMLQGDFGTVHEVAEDPAAVAAAYRAAGAALIHVVDLDGAKDGVRRNESVVAAIAAAAAPARIELGGGLRAMTDLARADALGVWRFVIGSAAVTDPAFVRAAAARYGERVAVGIDARDGRVRTEGWLRDAQTDALDLARAVEALGVRTIIFTDIAADGALAGPSLAPLRALRAACACRLVASGGVSAPEDLARLHEAGMDGVIVGKALYAGRLDLAESLRAAGAWAAAGEGGAG
ncbi:MAG: 1-(5-phosphoribosyl)-5-[(5-phosphoribosylamino)methylideneamino]imidazole-4-carboxamide isomerase [Oscillospiraceae bacterium]|jgi:phosphoribosylformimino-5-aminoimidazole carboxamide ribotide isomerase|nr:1-(5-phosphoribosyl)-5-[(5-phosphoribosylamino)methylideneamino]imidazole-4-carboxamide isomerase [Oscillospiraceae bacterium]